MPGHQIMNRHGALTRRQRHQRATCLHLRQCLRPRTDACERDAKHRTHRSANGFSIERITGLLVEQHTSRTERGRVAEDAADVVGIVDSFEQQERPWTGHGLGAGSLRRSMNQRQAPAVNIDTGQLAELIQSRLYHRHFGANARQRTGEIASRRVADQDRMQFVPPVLDHPANDQASFGNEQPMRTQELTIRDPAIQRRTRVHTISDG